MNDAQIQAQAYSYFLVEAPELLQTIEQEILTLPSEHTTLKVHSLMRALHTLKGAAASVGLETIVRIAHDLEDVARVFYDLDVEIDLSIQSLLLDGYSGLQECLAAQITDRQIDDLAILDRLAQTLAQLKVKLGDWSEADIALPTSMELGFDIVASIFETTIQEQIDEIVTAMATRDPDRIATCFESVTDTCIGLAESFELPGFLAINRAIISAIAAHPAQIAEIAAVALANLQQAQIDVLAGDRTLGGTLDPNLANLAGSIELEIASTQIEPLEISPSNLFEIAANGIEVEEIANTPIEPLEISPSNPFEIAANGIEVEEIANTPIEPLEISPSNPFEIAANGEDELLAFQSFLVSDNFRKRHELSADNKHLFNQIIRLCWDWFKQEIQTPSSQLNLELLVTTDGLADLDYIHHWIGLLLQKLDPPNGHLLAQTERRSSLQLYRQCCIYQVVFAVAKYLAGTEPHPQLTPEFLTDLRLHLQITADTYKQGSPVTANERGWIDRIIIPHHWGKISAIATEDDLLLNEIWGQADFGNS